MQRNWKKGIAFLLTSAFCFPCFTQPSEALTNPVGLLYGDLNEDGTIDLTDVRIALEASLGIQDAKVRQIASSDFDQDGKIGMDDVTVVLKAALSVYGDQELKAALPKEPEVHYDRTSDHYSLFKEALIAMKAIRDGGKDALPTEEGIRVITLASWNANEDDVLALQREIANTTVGGTRCVLLKKLGDVEKLGIGEIWPADQGFTLYGGGFWEELREVTLDGDNMCVERSVCSTFLDMRTYHDYYQKVDGEWKLVKSEESSTIS